MKPLGCKAYGSIGHLPGSKLGPGDYTVCPGWAEICTVATRRQHRDRVIVTEKLDGACVAVAKINGAIVPLGRAGYLAAFAEYPHLRLFHDWAMGQERRWDDMLVEGERICSEWLALAHSVRYRLHHEPFVAFDIIRASTGKNPQGDRVPHDELVERCRKFDIVTPTVIHAGDALPIDKLDLWCSGHGAIDQIEGVVYRVESHGKFNFLAKYVRADFVPGRFLNGEPVWNWQPEAEAA